MPPGIPVPIDVAFTAAISPYSGQSGRQCHFDTGAAARSAPFGRGEPSDQETRTGPNLETLETQPKHGRDAGSAPPIQSQPTDSYRNVSEPMSQYLSAFALLLLVMSPPLVPAVIGLVHRIVLGVRAVANARKTAPAPSLT
jgi:hypothetical protein